MQHQQQVADLCLLLRLHGVKQVVICPGSRNAPLIQAFTAEKTFRCHSLVDERSAGYYALGMARELGQAVAVVTTSGTAVLNLGPAAAEAYHQEIPLLLITADRPARLQDKKENQTINQKGVFRNHSRRSITLPGTLTEKGLLHSQKLIKDALRKASGPVPGPVHINVPLDEPLYTELPPPDASVTGDTADMETATGPTAADIKEFAGILKGIKKILVLPGQMPPSKNLRKGLELFVRDFHAVVLYENITNLAGGKNFIGNTDLLLGAIPAKHHPAYQPELVITFGGHLVSKKIRDFIRHTPDTGHWHISAEPSTVDHFDKLSKNITTQASLFFSGLTGTGIRQESSDYLNAWTSLHKLCMKSTAAVIQQSGFSNISAVNEILTALPAETVLHLGNSGVIRYSQLFPYKEGTCYFSNRGTSGIDGSLSSAAGAATVSGKNHVAILGDLSFVYDSNAMWNRNFPVNLKIIILNDEGGGIFRIIEGPDTMPYFEEYAIASHPVDLEKLAATFGLKLQRVDDASSLKAVLPGFCREEAGPSILEISTGKCENSAIFKALFKKLQAHYHAEQELENN